MKYSKRFLSAASACVLICGFLPGLPASAEERSGTCGENITWELDDNGLLTISGTGAMTNFGAFGAPYNKLRNEVLSVSISEGITNIGSGAFSACNITEIVLPESIETIGESAFEACGSLASVHFPAKLKTVASRAFTQCSKLTEVTLPDTVTAIGAYAFGRCPMKSFVIPPNVTSLGGSLFDSCWALEEITIPESVTNFGPTVFLRTPWLEAKQAEDPLVIVNNVVVDGETCTGVVTIPDTVTALSGQCFYGCGGMTGIELNDNITDIPYYTFAECGLTEITLPASVKHIARQAFWGCGNLKKVTILNPDCVIETEDDSKTFPHDTVICGYEGSTAQAYATFRRDFVSLGEFPLLRGDVNGDGEFNSTDISDLQKWLLSNPDTALKNWKAGDLCKNEVLNSADLSKMKQLLLHQNVKEAVKPDNETIYSAPFHVIAEKLDLHLGPDESYPVIDSIPKGTFLEEKGWQEHNDYWVFVEYKEQHGWIRIMTDDNKTRTARYEEMADKPVIYLYPEKESDVHVELELSEAELSTTYPKYNDGWDVTAYPDGTLLNKPDGTHHRYLFWDAVNCSTRFDFSAGFCVAGSDTEQFLKDKLSEIGLTEDELNEFIVYWLPRMEHNAYNLIAFQGEAYTNAAKLNITPAPDSLLRVFMTYVPLKQPVEITPQHFESFERNGFTVVEWGGSEIKAGR